MSFSCLARKLLLVLVLTTTTTLSITTASASSHSSTSNTASSQTSYNQHQHQQQHNLIHSLLRRSLQEEQSSSSPNSETPTPSNNTVIEQHYELWEPHEIRERVYRWADHYPDLIRVTTAQETYNLSAAGSTEDCPFDHGDSSSSSSSTTTTGCLNYILTIQDYITHPEGSDSSKRLPEVLWSGEVHGNEQVGPTAVLEATLVLLEAAACEAHPRISVKAATTTSNNNNDDDSLWQLELQKAETCRQELKQYGIDDAGRKWLARLVSTRRIVVVPTANALGYYRKVREEGNIDPNRDFPYDLHDPQDCMQTIAGRTLNEVFRQHMFQLSLTFHGGMEVIGYEWGAPSWRGGPSPDDRAQDEIAAAYSHYGGGWKLSPPYDYGAMNDKVYPVEGGMEDWAYAGSWDHDRVIQCQPTTFDGYPVEKTTYYDGTLRVFNMLVESSDRKIPPSEMLGSSLDLLQSTSAGTGYVSRNIRLSLLAAELVEPYVSITTVNELILSDDVVPMNRQEGRSCQETKLVGVPFNSKKVIVRWSVGGALTVDDTRLWYAKWSDIPSTSLDCMTQPSAQDLQDLMKVANPIKATNGTTRFSSQGNSNPFTAVFDISNYQAGDKLVLLALAKVDQAWLQQPDLVIPNLPPQSHIVNARTNESWYYETETSVIQGRLHWFSMPLTIELVDGSNLVETIELSSRFSAANPAASTPSDADPSDTKNNESSDSTTTTTTSTANNGKGNIVMAALVVCILGVILLLVARYYVNHKVRAANRNRVLEFIKDETAPSPGLKHKKRNGYSDVPDDLDLNDYGGVEMKSYTAA